MISPSVPRRAVGAALLLALCVGCDDDDAVAPDPCVTVGAALDSDSGTASGRWLLATRAMIARRDGSPLSIVRTLAYVHVAEHDAAVAAGRTGGAAAPSVVGAISGAAAGVLPALYPAESLTVASRLDDEARRAAAVDARCAARFTAGVALGRATAATILARAATDGSTLAWAGTIPTGPGRWLNAPAPAQPLAPRFAEVRAWHLARNDEFRPAAPPAFGSAAWTAALAEVRAASAGRTPEQLRLAQRWGVTAGTAGPPGIWTEIAMAQVAAARLDELETTRTLAMVSMAMMDAAIACWDAKYTWWTIRPWQEDPAITTPVGRPNFPAFPSLHSCVSAAAGGVLGARFPASAPALQAQVDSAGVSRIFAGLHYRFDVTAGQAIGAAVAARVYARRPLDVSPILAPALVR